MLISWNCSCKFNKLSDAEAKEIVKMVYYKLITTVHNSESIIPDVATLLPYCKSIQVRFGEKLEDADKTYLTF